MDQPRKQHAVDTFCVSLELDMAIAAFDRTITTPNPAWSFIEP